MIVWFVVWLGVWSVVLRPWRHPARPLAEPAPSASPVPVPWREVGLVVAGGALVLEPVVTVIVGVGLILGRRRRQRSTQALHRQEALGRLPEVLDLVSLGVAAGQTPRRAIESAGPLFPAPYAAAAAEASRRASAGVDFADALDTATRAVGVHVESLVNVVADGGRSGPVLPTLVRLADDARRRRRAAAEERARRLPVTLLAPLVLCILPAFGLLAVVPLVLGSLRTLSL